MAPRVAAIIQARMASTRMPGKVLSDIAGRPLLWHVIHRLRKCRNVDVIAVAAPDGAADDAIAGFCADHSVPCIRGPEDNVLARYALAAEACGADVVVRVTSDAPLIDPDFVDYLIEGMLAAKADFVVMADGAAVAHEGADPMTRRALDKLVREAGDDPVAREHVSAYFKAHPDFVTVASLPAPAHLQFHGARLSVDTPADASFVAAIYDRLQAQAGEASLSDLIALLRRDPSLMSLNAHVVQKTASQSTGTILMRCDGGGALGLGHVKRSLAIGRILRDAHGFGVRFAMTAHPLAESIVRGDGFPVDAWSEAESEAGWLRPLIARTRARAVIFDTRIADHGAASVARRMGCLTAVVDDGSVRRRDADLAFYPPVAQASELDWTGARTQRFTGWDWAVTAAPPLGRAPRNGNAPLNVLITMGGSDPAHQTVPAARAAAAVLGTHHVTVALGPDVTDRADVVRALRQLPGPMMIVEAAQDLRPLMARTDLAVAMFGVTAYELASHGVPALYLCLTPDHARSASAFVAANLGRIIGPSGCGEAAIAGALRATLADASGRADMAAAGLRTIDGRGAERIASLVADTLNMGMGLRKAG